MLWTRLLVLALLVAFSVSSSPESVSAKPASVNAAKKKKRRARRRRKKPNMPQNWSWPPNRAMKSLGRECLAELTELGVEWKKVRKRPRKVATPIIVPSMMFAGLKLTPIFRKPPFVIDCHLARAIALAAPAILDSGITELRFSTIHQYRRVRLRGRVLRALSRHSLGLAIDVYGFITRDDTKVVIEHEYRGSAHAHALEATFSLSGQLRALLTPGNDPRSHYDHFHLEARMTIPDPPRRKRSKRRRR